MSCAIITKTGLKLKRFWRAKKKRKAININKHAGVIRLNEDPVSFQRRMRNTNLLTNERVFDRGSGCMNVAKDIG